MADLYSHWLGLLVQGSYTYKLQATPVYNLLTLVIHLCHDLLFKVSK